MFLTVWIIFLCLLKVKRGYECCVSMRVCAAPSSRSAAVCGDYFIDRYRLQFLLLKKYDRLLVIRLAHKALCSCLNEL